MGTTFILLQSRDLKCLAKATPSQTLQTTALTDGQDLPSAAESWFEVSGQGQPKPSQPEEGTLVPSHSREEMEHLLASAASEEELSDTDLT